jgi:y4mF family transcriptional regulator
MIAIHNSTDLGQATRAARKRLGLTQPQLALAAGVGVRFIVEMEAGKPSLRLSSVLQVLGALGGRLAVEGLEDELPAGSATALTAPPSKPARKID